MSDNKVVKLSDYTSLDSEFIQNCKAGIKKLEDFVERYVQIQELEPIEQIRELESLKREHGAYLTYFLRFYSQVAMYRENGEFLASERKTLKSQSIEELTHSGTNITTADKIVYGYDKYKTSIVDIQSIRKFLIYVYETYDQHKNIITRNIHQSISVLQKELENNKRTQI
ncbi:MAG: hypothetical protein LBM02_10155 [Lachnospiraceae bacterium]|jgi:hypothetical protein|nr:hypothetical protein [Lachnospiraceae bacterium]